VELADGSRLTGVFDKHPRPRGARVQVVLDPDGCFAFPTDHPTHASPADSQSDDEAVTLFNRTPVEIP
jgi:iron(III) transport system ATP-binding protein